jgi:hypothetical protein
LEEEGGLRKRKAIKKTQQLRRIPSRTYLSLLPEVALHFRVLTDSTDGSSTIQPLTSDAIRLAEGPANKVQLRSNKDPKTISNQNTKEKKSDAHLSQYAPKAHLQAVEAYSESFRD